MRLSQIKLAGFKSFVDPTVIATPGQLVGVVGPNGCGKSNIIDAVRWVLGESRASELRGESMQDVIFNGSSKRRASSRASVELVFDNSVGRAGGQWGSYAEIAIRRILTRDAGSTYYINGQVVRRRDVHDLFLGTGLGVRGYAIIGQGMINRLIEARPEELRVYLEEAAGVSRYKERRRDTENRLASTRDNLQRLEDILGELASQLEKLEKQAGIARQYEALRTEREQKQFALWFLHEQEARSKQQAFQQALSDACNRLEEAQASVRRSEASLETLRQQHHSAADQVHSVQGKFFESGAQVSRLETEIKHVSDSRLRLQQRLIHQQKQLDEWVRQVEHCRGQSEEIQQALEQAADKTRLAQEAEQQASQLLPDFETKERESRQLCARLRDDMTRLEKELALRHQARNDMARRYQSLMQKQDQLQQSLRDVARPDPTEQERLAAQQQFLQQQLGQVQTQIKHQGDYLAELEQQCQSARNLVQLEADKLSRLQARQEALQALQITMQQQEGLESWLQEHGFGEHARLWQRLTVRSGWEVAVEAVLRERLSAIALSGFDHFATFLQNPPPGRLIFYHPPQGAADSRCMHESTQQVEQVGSPSPGIALGSLVSSDDADVQALLNWWLADVEVVTSLEQALSRVDTLAPGQQLVCAEGHLLDRYSLIFYAPDSESSGLLARQNEIHELQEAIHLARQSFTKAQEALAADESLYRQRSLELEELRSRQALLIAQLHQTEMDLVQWQQRDTQEVQRAAYMQEELDELALQREELSGRKEELQLESDTFAEEYDEVEAQLHDMERAGSLLTAQAEQIRAELGRAGLTAKEAQFEERRLTDRLTELRRNLDLARDHAGRGRTEIDHLELELAGLDASVIQEELQEALDRRTQHEAALAAARADLDALDIRLRDSDRQRLTIEQTLDPLRHEITDIQLKEQAARLAIEQYADQLVTHQVDRSALAGHIQQQPASWQSADWLQSEVQRLGRRLDSLGPVNLAALDELGRAHERRGFLDSQYLDLTTAIHTLEDAIRKIDRETRALLQKTFDTVNQHFGELFPQLFGGGQARLTMTGDEILDAGVLLMAQPPGKRNSTIHLLSGGEKALTAIALVFALFKLNPAPFCLLDEVDAPLDDANTGRYADLVRSMADQTQFLFISHNKIAMQMARQLVGVTMQEQGVSRIVAVDIDTAVRMAEL